MTALAPAVALALLLLETVVVARLRHGLPDAPTRWCAVANLLGVVIVWSRANRPWEGPSLLSFSDRHALTAADLAAVPALVVVVLLLLQVVSARLKRR